MRALCAALIASLAGAVLTAQAPDTSARGSQQPAQRGQQPATPRGGRGTAERGQPPAERGGQPPTAERGGQPPARGAATPPDSYRYDPGGRRDPFRDLLTPTGEATLTERKAIDGLAGLSVNDITVRGVLQNKGAFIAMVQAPDKKTYLVHQGDKFLDGTVRSVTPQGLVIVQDVRDPLSLVKQREIRKLLRSAEGAKP
jgi:Tfp pilus assembly protein PilP